MRIHTSRLGFVLLAATMLSGIPGYCVQDAQAQGTAERQLRFDIPAQPVPQALNAIGRVAGISVVVNGSAASGARSQAVSGSLTARQALAAALAETGPHLQLHQCQYGDGVRSQHGRTDRWLRGGWRDGTA